MSVVVAILGLAAVASLGYRVLGVLAVGQVLRDAPLAPERPAQSVALLRPLCGAPDYLDACLASLWHAAAVAEAPIHIGIEDPTDPAHKEVVRLREAHPEVAVTLHSGSAGAGRNRKAANLAQMDAAAAELLILSDDDVRVPADYVARTAAPFVDPAVGASTAPYRSVGADSLSSRLDALLTNLHFLPSTCAAVQIEGLQFGLGATLVLRREALAEIGGFTSILDVSGDDFALAHEIQARGWKLAWVPLVVEHLLADVGLRAAFDRHLRCARITRSNRLVGTLGLMLVTHGWLLALIVAAAGGGLSWLVPTAWWAMLGVAQHTQRRALGIDRWDLLLGPVVDVLGLCVMCAALGGRPAPPGIPGEPAL